MTTETPRRRGRPPSGGREAILAATIELMREEGIARVTSREVAARAGVSDASVYYHFGDRPGLLRAAYEFGMRQKLELLDELHPGMDRREVLTATFHTLELFFADVVPIMHAAQADSELGQTLAAYVEENDLGPHRGVTRLAAYIREEQAAGRANRAADPEAVALLLIDSAFSRVARRQMLAPDESDPRLPSAERLLASINAMLDPPAHA